MRWIWAVLALGVLGGCGGATDAAAPPERRPVRVLPLQISNPGQQGARLTGVVTAWKEEDLPFEVGGRVTEIVEESVDVGRVEFVDGEIRIGPNVVGRLDTERYAIKLDEAKASIAALEAQQKSVTRTIEGLEAQLAGAESEREYAQAEAKRILELESRGQETPREAQRAQTAADQADAAVKQLEASIEAQQAQLRSFDAQIAQASAQQRQAELDLEDCELRAPFPGTITEVHVLPGAYVQPGQPVVRLMMMDPIEIEVAVSAETDRRINRGDVVFLHAPDADAPTPGMVRRKSTVADAQTRTFKLQVFARNYKVVAELPADPNQRDLPRINDIMPIVKLQPRQPGPWYAEQSAIYEDAGGQFVYRLENLEKSFGGDHQPVVRLKKFYITTGEHAVRLVHFRLQQLAETDGLVDPSAAWWADDPRLRSLEQVIGPLEFSVMLAVGVPPALRDQDELEVLLLRERWRFRPGELIGVELPEPTPGDGFYVPARALVKEGDAFFVFIVDTEDGETVARRLPLDGAGQRVRDQVRIESAAGAKTLAPGMQLIVEGAAFLHDGAPILVTNADAEPQP